MTFNEFNFKTQLQKSIDVAGFKEPSPVQKDAIPIVLTGKDLVAQAHTGTGKTAAFGLPLLQMMQCKGDVETLVIVPTRELAMQVSDELFRFGKFLDIKTATVYGGTSYSRQIKHVQSASIIVATPGRLLDLLSKKQITINPKYVVLDEADEMLDMGFLEDIKNIFTFLPKERQTLMFSATMPKPIKDLSKRILNEPEYVTITKSEVTQSTIKQLYYVVDEYERDDALIRLYDYKNPTKSIVFCKMKRDVDRLSTYLISQGFSAKGLHGDMEQRQREEVIRAFKGGNLEVLVATDVAARGLDVRDVTHVFNYQLPFDSESYVHRIGRTGRAGRDGTAISIVTPHEFRQLTKIQKDTGGTMESRVIPTIGDVKVKKASSLVKKIEDVEITEHAYALLEELKDQYDISTIAQKLASLLIEDDKVGGKENIGKSAKDITFLLSRAKNDKGGGKGRHNSRGFRGRRSGGKSSGRDGGRDGGRSSGGRSSGRDGGRSSGGRSGGRSSGGRSSGRNSRG
ncbi:MAG: DEAD/DEAH box helicase [Campylobacterota bacterium]|nr:DEAD/DEAH box helicase [Campylobacterota bacterium]